MSGRKRNALKSGMIGLISQSSSLVLQIISRKVFIQFIGEEILGLNGTFASILSTISLAELGFQNAVAFHLYRPLAEKNQEKINIIVNIYKTVYRALGIFFCVASVFLLPFLKYILKNTDITSDVYVFFLLQAMASACSYFLAYRRTILFADQKEYIYRMIDAVMNFVFKTAQIAAIVVWHSYIVYLLLQIIQVYASNLIVHFICIKKYPYINKTHFDKGYAKKILFDVKEISIGRFASYVYSSTDNLLISSFLGPVYVALLGNYATITTNLRFLTNGVLGCMVPIIGNYLAEGEDKRRQEEKFHIYQHLRYVMSMVLLIPTFTLIDDFVTLWVGEVFVLSFAVKTLLIADQFLQLLHGACVDYISAKGLFKQSRVILSITAITNLVISVIGVLLWGMEGILVGTVCSQVVGFFGYGWIMYKCFFNEKKAGYGNYLLKNLYFAVTFVISTVVCIYVYDNLPMAVSVGRFIIGGCVCEGIVVVSYLLLNCKSNEMRSLLSMIISAAGTRKKKEEKNRTGDF